MDSRQGAKNAMTTEQLRAWLRDWVIATTGLPAEEITDDKPMQSFGLSSRDVVLLSGELENLLGVQLDATIAYEYPTITALSKRLVEGAPASNLHVCRSSLAPRTPQVITTLRSWAWRLVTQVRTISMRCGPCSLRGVTASQIFPSDVGRNTQPMRLRPKRWPTSIFGAAT